MSEDGQADRDYWNDKYDAPPDCGICEYGCDCDDWCEYCGPWHDADDDEEEE